MRCEAKSKQSGLQCRRHAVVGKRVCNIHGGKSLESVASPTYKTGRYSKYLPERLAERYQESQNDAALLEMREEVSLIDSRLADLIKRVDSGESGHVWKALKSTHKELTKASLVGDSVLVASAMYDIGQLINVGYLDYQAWSEISAMLEQRRKIVESERKRLVESKTILTIDQAMLMIGALTDIIRTHVTDRQILAAITTDVNKLIMVEGS